MFSVICSNLNNINSPSKNGDVGYDLIASSDPIIMGNKITKDSLYYNSVDYIEYEVDLKIEPPDGCFSLVFPRSSISKYNLQLCNSVGVIDSGYRGKIKLRFNYISQPKDLLILNQYEPTKQKETKNIALEVNLDKIYKKGDKIGQIVFCKALIPCLIEGEVSSSERGEDGFGSTGK